MIKFSEVKGKMAKDNISGFKGTITGHGEYITGCDTYLLTPKVDKDGGFKEGHWFDENRIEVLPEDRPENQSMEELIKEAEAGHENGAMDPAPIK